MSKETVLNKNAFLVSETDAKGIIRFANEDFCNIAGYSLSEMLGKPHNMVRHKDMPKAAFFTYPVQISPFWTVSHKDLNAAKDGGYYWVFATVYPFESCDGSKGYLSCRRKPSIKEIEKAEKLYEEMRRNERN